MEHDEEGSSEYGSGSEYTESGDEGDEEEVDEEEVDEEEEPKLKYMRLGSNVTETLRRDAASCMAVHERFLVCPAFSVFVLRRHETKSRRREGR